MKIVINGRELETDSTVLSYDQIISYARGHNIWKATVTYKGSDDEGSLVSGESVELEEGMIFNAVVTDSA